MTSEKLAVHQTEGQFVYVIHLTAVHQFILQRHDEVSLQMRCSDDVIQAHVSRELIGLIRDRNQLADELDLQQILRYLLAVDEGVLQTA